MTVCLGSTGVYSCWSFCNSGGGGGGKGGGGVGVPESDLHAVDFWCVIWRMVNFPVVFAGNHHVLCVFQYQKRPFIRTCSSIVRNFCSHYFLCYHFAL